MWSDSGKARYFFLKSKGICVCCGQDNAMINSQLCPECSQKAAARYHKQWLKIKQTYYAEYKRNRNKQARDRRAKMREMGICVKCGKRKPQKGKVNCSECLLKERNKYHNKHNNISRNERSSYGFCYICDSPVKEGYKVCGKHYKMAVTNLKLDTCSEKRRQTRENFKRGNDYIFHFAKEKILLPHKTYKK